MEGLDTIRNCNSIEQVVEYINSATKSSVDPAQLAAAYAADAAEEAGYEMESKDFEVHLDVLSEVGAEFNYVLALRIAIYDGLTS